ncbi:succinyl-CoA synthetase subunit alpha [candidate division TA06 bacterium DG_26]|uniref:Succinate--CoA ligase [ADP-forming] subunit alpha n=1 Tax=candidate division TA06 bacterium DG_26 TaxID=1703771 RepID=A0A0S7WK43_UNCT6|nr:MAG: succinyl-CoA synthetase subunit alpha [candidate division TA06 bacterium DG_26]
MSILVNENTRLVVQGITGRDGSFHAKKMMEYGTNVVAGCTPGKGGTRVDGIPVFNTVHEAVQKEGANTSCIFVPAAFAPDAVYESADAGIELVVCITEGIPALEIMRVVRYLRDKRTRLIGPNCPGIITPGKCKVGILPGEIFLEGTVGVVSRSGTLTYEIVSHLTRAGFGQSTVVGLGGDQIVGMKFIDFLKLFQEDEGTDAVVLIGEIGGTDEEQAADFFKKKMHKPMVAYIAGLTAPPGKRMGHAGAIISGGSGTAAEKIKAFEKVGVPVAKIPEDIPKLVAPLLK